VGAGFTPSSLFFPLIKRALLAIFWLDPLFFEDRQSISFPLQLLQQLPLSFFLLPVIFLTFLHVEPLFQSDLKIFSWRLSPPPRTLHISWTSVSHFSFTLVSVATLLFQLFHYFHDTSRNSRILAKLFQIFSPEAEARQASLFTSFFLFSF